MLQPRPFSYMHARPPEGKSFAAERLVRYHESTGRRIDTTHVKQAIQGLQAELATPHPSASLSVEDIVKISNGDMALPDHIRAAGPVRRHGDLRAKLAHLQGIVANADAHNEALDLGLNQLGRQSPKADNAGDDHA